MKNKFTALLAALALLLTACSDSDDHDTDIDMAPDITTESDHTEKTPAPKPEVTDIHAEVYVDNSDNYNYAVFGSINIDYEFTEEDRELQEILRELDPAWSVFAALYNGTPGSGIVNGGVGVLTDMYQYKELFYSELSEDLPFHTLDEMETELGKYFTKNIVEKYMSLVRASAGKISWEQDWVSTVSLTEHKYIDMNNTGGLTDFPIILELDGKLYRAAAGYLSYSTEIDYSLARVLSRADDEIGFVYMMPVPAYENSMIAVRGRLKYDDGVWKYCRLPLYNNEYMSFRDAYELWDVPVLYGSFDRNSLEKFDIDRLMEEAREAAYGPEPALDEGGYGEFRELYLKAYALVRCTIDPGSYMRLSDAKCSLEVPLDNGIGGIYYGYFLPTGYSFDSFYETLAETFDEELAQKLAGSYGIRSYDGALWCYPSGGGLYPVLSHLYDEYAVETPNADTLDIVRTSYYATDDMGWYYDPDIEFDPELKDQYDTATTHIVFVKTEKGWQCQRFDGVW